MQEWCMAHPVMTFLILISFAPTITIVWKRPRKDDKK